MKNLKLGDIVEYKVENEPYILAYRGSHLYSIIQLDVLGRFIAFSVPIGAQIQLIESSSMPVCEYKLLKEIGDFLKRVRFDIIDNEEPFLVYVTFYSDVSKIYIAIWFKCVKLSRY